MIKIKHRITGEVLYTVDAPSLIDANLRFADLRGADLENAKGVLKWQSPQGEKRLCYSVKHDDCIMHKLGCFWGSTDEAVTAIRKKYGDNSMLSSC